MGLKLGKCGFGDLSLLITSKDASNEASRLSNPICVEVRVFLCCMFKHFPR